MKHILLLIVTFVLVGCSKTINSKLSDSKTIDLVREYKDQRGYDQCSIITFYDGTKYIVPRMAVKPLNNGVEICKNNGVRIYLIGSVKVEPLE